MTLSGQGFTVHSAATYHHAKALIAALRTGLVAVIAHADMPNEPRPGTLFQLAGAAHPDAALVALSARSRDDIEPLPVKAVLLREPFDRAELMAAIVDASDPRRRVPPSFPA